MIEEPGRAEHAGLVGLVDPEFVVVQLDVVADASAEGARRVVDHLQSGGHNPLTPGPLPAVFQKY
ncbi:hypothetical protein D3C83_215870 [compost metagenome]